MFATITTLPEEGRLLYHNRIIDEEATLNFFIREKVTFVAPNVKEHKATAISMKLFSLLYVFSTSVGHNLS